jgi:proteasome lid subunit RPN8/RPN11
MFVFDGFATGDQCAKLEEIAKSLDKHQIYDNVGLYFRLPNTENGKLFNELIAKRKYNSQLDKDTKVVGVQSGKIPKFFLTNEWKPMSVVTLGVTLRHSKTAVYANCCDLVISHTDKNSIIETRNIWQ